MDLQQYYTEKAVAKWLNKDHRDHLKIKWIKIMLLATINNKIKKHFDLKTVPG